MHSNLVFILVRAGLLIDVHVQGLNKPRSSNWHSHHVKVSPTNPESMTITLTLLDDNYPLGRQTLHRKIMMILRTLLLRRFRLLNLLVPRLNMTCKHDQTYTHDTETVNFQKRRVLRGKCGRYMSVHNATNAFNEEFGDIDRAVFTANFCRVLNYHELPKNVFVSPCLTNAQPKNQQN